MTTTAKSGKSRQQPKPWWSERRNRNKVWLGLLGVGVVLVVALFVSLRSSGDGGGSSSASQFPSLYTFKTADLHSLTFDPAKDGRVLFGHHGGVMATDDSGRTWTTVVDRQNFDGMNLAFDPNKQGTLYLAGHNVISQSDDAGQTWTQFSHNLPGLDLHAFAASSITPGRYYTFALGRGLYVSERGPAYWAPLWPDAPQGTHSIVELRDGTLLVGASDQGVLRSDDGGKTWRESRAGIDTGAIYSLDGDPASGRVYAGTSNGLYTSADGGRTWQQTSLNDTQIVVVGVNPADPDEVMAIDGGGRLYRSTDGGNAWAS